MLKIIITVSLLLICNPNIFPQWSTDPNNNLIIGYGLNPKICSDSTGGCYITYEYGTTNYPRKLGLERLDKYGYKPWGTLKQILGELEEQWLAEIEEDGEGGVIISYLDDTIVWPDFTYRVRVQRVDSAGNFLWEQTGVRVTTTEINHGDQAIVGDGNGGCVVVWPNQLPNFTYEFRANRITNLGERAWSDTGIYLENRNDSEPAQIVRASDGNYYVQLSNIYRINQNGQIVNQYYGNMLGQPVPDPEGGIVLTGVTGSIYNRRLVAQRKDSLGNNVWQEPYVEIADSLHINTRLSIIQNNGYYFYGWMGKKNGNNDILQIQGLRNNGTLLFNQGSISLSNSPGNTTYIPIVASDSGSCIFINSYINGTFGQKIDTLGLLKWNSNQVLLNYPQIGLNSSFVTSDCVAGAIGLGDYLTDFAIPVFKVSTNGVLGEVITDVNASKEEKILRATILFQNYPNPFNSATIIKYQIANESNVKISLYNILGERLKILSDEYKSNGIHSLIFNSDDLPSGVYVYTLEINSLVLTKKLIILK